MEKEEYELRLKRKNRQLIYAVIALLIITSILIFEVSEIYKISKNTEKENIMLEEGKCYVQNLGSNGNGFTFPTDYCPQLKEVCEADFHNVPCSWETADGYENVYVCQCVFN